MRTGALVTFPSDSQRMGSGTLSSQLVYRSGLISRSTGAVAGLALQIDIAVGALVQGKGVGLDVDEGAVEVAVVGRAAVADRGKAEPRGPGPRGNGARGCPPIPSGC